MSNEYEQDYDKLAQAINDKVKAAAEALKEANALAKQAGFDRYVYRYDDLEYMEDQEMAAKLSAIHNKITFWPVLDEMDNAGWRTSSLHC